MDMDFRVLLWWGMAIGVGLGAGTVGVIWWLT